MVIVSYIFSCFGEGFSKWPVCVLYLFLGAEMASR